MNVLSPASSSPHIPNGERGNVLFIILLAVVLIGALTAAVQGIGGNDNAQIDDETLALRVSEVQSYANELERAVGYIMQGAGVSEQDLRFAVPTDATTDYGDINATVNGNQHIFQIFHADGGAAAYRSVSSDIVESEDVSWEFTGAARAPGMGTSRADLMAIIPDVTPAFCTRINELNGQSSTPSYDGTNCIYSDDGRFDGSTQFEDAGTVVLDESSFEQDATISKPYPAPQACVECADGALYFYHVLMAR